MGCSPTSAGASGSASLRRRSNRLPRARRQPLPPRRSHLAAIGDSSARLAGASSNASWMADPGLLFDQRLRRDARLETVSARHVGGRGIRVWMVAECGFCATCVASLPSSLATRAEVAALVQGDAPGDSSDWATSARARAPRGLFGHHLERLRVSSPGLPPLPPPQRRLLAHREEVSADCARSASSRIASA